MASLRTSAVLLATVALATACARSVPVTTTSGDVQTARADVQRWSAPLKPPSMTSSAVISTGADAGGATAAAYGSVTITQSLGTGSTRYDLNVTIPPAAGRQLAWALYTGSCTTASPPVVPVNELPPLDLGSGGSGTVRGNLPATLDPKTTYNLRVYGHSRASDVNDVVLCARLGFSGRK